MNENSEKNTSALGAALVGDDEREFDELGIKVPVPAHRPTWAEISLDNAVLNLQEIKKRVGPGPKIIAVVKADAYGHGIEFTQTIQDEGVDMMAVAFLDEAIALRQKGIDRCDIMILGLTPKNQIPDLVEWDIQPAVDSLEFARALSEYNVKNGTVTRIHAKVDTGMGRIGFRWDEAVDAIAEISEMPSKRLFAHTAFGRDSKRFPIQQAALSQMKRYSSSINVCTLPIVWMSG